MDAYTLAGIPVNFSDMEDDILQDLIDELRRSGADDGLLDDALDERTARDRKRAMQFIPEWACPR